VSGRQLQRRTQSGASGQPNEQIQAELIDLAAADIGDPRLRDAKYLRGLGLNRS
jgi:hypothetical protein